MIPQVQQEAPVAIPQSKPQWSLPERIGFRFVFSYFILYLGPGAIGALGVHGSIVATPYRTIWASIWHNVVPWVGTNVLQVQGDYREIANGSGDQLYDYVLVFCIFILALIVTAIWSWLDRKRTNYDRLNAWLRMLMRLSVAGPMIGYGVAKLFRAQFPEPALVRLIDPLGHMSPMGLLWTFTGSSRLYSFFGGFGEALAGVLLIFPQLATLGSLIMLGVMSNVLMLNLCYDVPRKIFSIHLMLIGVYYLLPDMRRLANMFVFNRPVEPSRPEPLFDDKQWNRFAMLMQIAFGLVVIGYAINQAHIDQVQEETHVGAAFRGIWYVDDFVLDNVPHPPLLTDQDRWRYLVLDSPEVINLQMMDESLQQYALRLDEQQNKLSFTQWGSTRWKGDFSLDRSQPDSMTLTGQLDDRPLTVRLRRLSLSDPSQFLLINRGFHWVNQFPYRR